MRTGTKGGSGGMRGGTDMKIFYKGAKTYFSGNKGKSKSSRFLL